MRIDELSLALAGTSTIVGEVVEESIDELRTDLEERVDELNDALALLDDSYKIMLCVASKKLTPRLLISQRNKLEKLGKEIKEFVDQWEF